MRRFGRARLLLASNVAIQIESSCAKDVGLVFDRNAFLVRIEGCSDEDNGW